MFPGNAAEKEDNGNVAANIANHNTSHSLGWDYTDILKLCYIFYLDYLQHDFISSLSGIE